MAISSSPVQLVRPKRFGDARGWFTEVYSVPAFDALGITPSFVQDNHSLSVPAFTLRGLHFQTPPRGQDKLVRCVRGAIFDVAVDVGLPFVRAMLPLYVRPENLRLRTRLVAETMEVVSPLFARVFEHLAREPGTGLRIARGEQVDPAKYYFRASPTFETGDKRYSWLNRIICVCSGVRTREEVLLDFYEVK